MSVTVPSLEQNAAPKLMFSQDSPLFAKSIDDQTRDIANLSDYLKTLTHLMKKFCKDAKNLAKSAEVLSYQMKEGYKASSTQQTFIPILGLFGDVFAEIADSQATLSASLELNFAAPVEKFYSEAIASIFTLKSQYLKERDRHDDKIIRYLQSDSSSAFIRGSNSNQAEYRAMDVVTHRKNLELIRFDLVRQINEVEAKKSFELTETCIASMIALRSHQRACTDRVNALTNFTAEYSKKQQQERQEFAETKAPLDRQRRDLSHVLDILIERVDNQIPQTPADVKNETVPDGLSVGALTDDLNALTANNMMGTISKIGAMGVAMGANWIGGFKRGSETSESSKNSGSQRKKHGSMQSPEPTSEALSPTSGNSSAISSLNVEETEMRMKALDRAELESFYTDAPSESFSGVVMQGFVLEKSVGKIMQTVWNRRWLVLDDTKLYIVKEGYDLNEPLGIQILCDIILSSVREVRNPELPFTFEVAYANMKTYTFQAEGPKEYQAWIDNIRTCIEKQLIAGPVNSPNIHNSAASHSSKATMMPFTSALSSHATSIANPQIASDISIKSAMKSKNVSEILKNNNTCCECGKSDPDWVSLNLGCLICIDCSGVHRSLGVHLSKVRSLTLDDLEAEEYELLKRSGNAANKSIWEADLKTTTRSPSPVPNNVPDSDIRKPHPKDDHASRDRFIRAKYITKAFLGHYSHDNRDIELLEACARDDVHTVLQLLSRGVSVNGESITDISTRANLQYRVPILVAAQAGALSTVVLLLLNGADILLSDPSFESSETIPAIAIARKHNRLDIVQYLSRKAEQLGLISILNSSMAKFSFMDSPRDLSTGSDDSGFDSMSVQSPVSAASSFFNIDVTRQPLPVSNRVPIISSSPVTTTALDTDTSPNEASVDPISTQKPQEVEASQPIANDALAALEIKEDNQDT